MQELFRDIEGYEGLYQISNLGNVRSFKAVSKGGNLKPVYRKGYLTVTLRKNGVSKIHSIHRLIATAFIPNPDNLPCVNHKDGNKLNNDLSNLEWCTYSHNNKHAYKTGLKNYAFTGGENSANHKLTESEVKFIRENYKKNDAIYGGRALAKRFNVSDSCISSVMLGKSWGGV